MIRFEEGSDGCLSPSFDAGPNRMTLAELLEGRFRADVRFRGAAYFKAERVAVARVTADELFAVVRDGVEYQTQLSRQDGQLKMFCNCVVSAQTEPTCKHLWGTILAADEGSYLSGEIKAEHVPPFFTEAAAGPGSRRRSGRRRRSARATSSSRAAAGSDAISRAPPRSPRPAGRRGCCKCGKRSPKSRPLSRPAPREQEIFYEIDVDQSRSIGQVVIQTSHRQRRGNGQWGKLKPLRLRPIASTKPIDADDARILAYLSGGTPERTQLARSAGGNSKRRAPLPHSARVVRADHAADVRDGARALPQQR